MMDQTHRRLKRIVILFLTLFIAGGVYYFFLKPNNPETVNDVSKWKNHKIENGLASVSFPYKPEKAVDKMAKGDSVTYRTKSSDDQNSYEVIHYRYAADGKPSNESLKAYVSSLKKGSVRRQIISSNEKYFVYEGRDAVDVSQGYKFDGEEMKLNSRIIFLESGQLLILQTFGTNKEAVNSTYFINSLEL